jgi:copper(I)-binding protein
MFDTTAHQEDQMSNDYPRRALVCLGLAATLFAHGHAFAQQPLQVRDAWARATVAQQQASGAFMTLTAPDDQRLVGAASPVAGVVEVHEMKLVDGVMRMRALSALDLPAGKAVELRPGGYHVMLMDLKQPLAQGQEIPLDLTTETRDGKRSTIRIQVPVRSMTAQSGMPMQHGSIAPRH